MDQGSKCRITVDGQAYVGEADEPLIPFLERNGVAIPHICYHPALGPIQSCDTCWIEVDGSPRRACTTTLANGMTVAIESQSARETREEGLNRVLKNHDLYCTLCDNNNGTCTVHNTVRDMGVEHQVYPYTPKPYEVDASNPFYRYDPDQCILCGRCVEACQNLQVNETLSIDWSLERPRVVWDGGQPINESSCVSCGHCVTVCPCNALMEKSMLGKAGVFTAVPEKARQPMIDAVKAVEPATGFIPIIAVSELDAAMRKQDVRRTKTVCTYCGVGCSFEMWTRGRDILKVEPSEGPANGVSTCVKGKFGWDFVNHEDRLTTPLIRENGRFREASWDEALGLVARRFAEIRDAHGPDALGFIASSKCTNEEAYLMQKFARGVIGTNNIDNCSRYCQNPATTGLFRTVSYGGDSGGIASIEQADLVLIVGSNTAESHPVLATRVKRAHKLRGQQLVVADLRKHEMAERADVFIRPRPGTDLVWLSALSRYILDQGLEDKAFLAERVNGLDELRTSLAPFTLEYAESVSGIPANTLRDLAERVARSSGVCVLWAMGVTQHCGGSDTSTAISNLLLITGNYGRPGTGAYPLRGHNNVQGASDFGAITAFLPGYSPVSDETARARFGQGWGVTLPEKPGLDNHEMVDAVHAGELKSMYVIGEDMALVDSNALYVQSAFEKLDFFVVQDIFLSRTAQFADVVLPAAPSVEKEGTFSNTERRIQRLYEVMPPLGDSRPDWRILTGLAERLGRPWGYTHPSEIMAEAASLTPLFAGVDYARLEGFASLQWPVAADGTDTPILFTERFPFPDGRARLHPVEWTEPAELPDLSYDLHLNNGRLLEQFHEGNMTNRSRGIHSKVPDTFVELSPELAQRRGVRDGSRVRLTSRRGSIEARVLVTDRVQGDELYMPMNSVEEPINVLTGSHTDRVTHTPAYKELSVSLEVIEADGPTPLPPHNSRYGHPTPKDGPELREKWRRADYQRPPHKLPEHGGL